ncbi:MAG: TetR/AcrR family transcriptional regulator [Ktedonobacteraceae bacterium]|nr:TetR/AcrR family transcriptional regulator [Ktedonobacteraceae bacterium]MBA3823729.1 TetR/AcrR family transcriptional regulator [Ktedonobacterales bacterium]
MSLRANAKADTERRILEAAERLFLEMPYLHVHIEDIALAAGVSAPTVIHRFGSKEALVAAAARSGLAHVQQQRREAPVGDLTGAIANLCEHYEIWGDAVMHLLAQEAALPVIREVTDAGRALHVQWVETTFAPWLPDLAAMRRRRIAQLVALLDVAVWKVLRRDRGLSKAETELAMREMVAALLEDN